MTDHIDRAQLADADRTGRIIEAHQNRARPHGDGICCDCDEAIPPSRLAAERCIECQTLYERKEATRVGIHR
ncbi:TraR/DksA family transcriptional regulator [Aeromonas veronii]|uniref:TraR/DksA family transcriptional regulator n=1 Tax=Aeromonas veronii TaxID=654 RepID=UPI00191E9FD7|nr:TraR/DksA family transcriptional regulator [Aeromonas veronii]MBL0640032.1 TraR/DksA family transcriptional regulator [Aeromonas veronii]